MTDTYVLTKPPASVLDLLTPQAIKALDHVLGLLRRLHKRSLEQEDALKLDGTVQKFKTDESIVPAERQKFFDHLMQDILIALVPDKCIYMYNLVRAIGSLNVIEAGTSFGVSTMYLALAVGQNAERFGKTFCEAGVIATENEPAKARLARQYWTEAGQSVEPWIDLREGDLTQTLKSRLPEIDFVLFDSTHMSRTSNLYSAADQIPSLDADGHANTEDFGTKTEERCSAACRQYAVRKERLRRIPQLPQGRWKSLHHPDSAVRGRSGDVNLPTLSDWPSLRPIRLAPRI